MTRRRFFAPPEAFDPLRDSVTLGADEAKYLREVLRLKSGEEAFVFDGAGREFHCRIDESRRDSALLSVIEEVAPARPESPLSLTLAVALLKGEKFDLVVQKVTELGATRIIPLTTKLADIRLRDPSDAAKRVTRWQRIALEAAKQSGRAVVPAVDRPISLDSLISSTDASEVAMFAERDGQPFATLETRQSNPPSLTAVVGSEGGWTDLEMRAAADAGWCIITLSGRILRAETAAITVAALLQHRFGDLR